MFRSYLLDLTLLSSYYFQEIDYTKEAENAERFADNFKDMDYVKVPTINWDYTTPQVWTIQINQKNTLN